MKTTNINPIDRIQRIAMTGDITEPKPLSPVENIMQHYPKVETQAQEPEEGGFWNSVKNFAGSKGGRMLIGGLGTGLAVGLTGGGLQNALGYGVIGAGKTAENLYKQEQDQKAWEDKEAERLARQQENAANRQFDAQMKMAEIEAQRQARQDAFENAKTMLGLNKDNAIKTEIEKLKAIEEYQIQKILNDPTLSDEQKKVGISRLNSNFDYDAYYTHQYYNGTPEEQVEAETYFARKKQYKDLTDPFGIFKDASGVAKNGNVDLDPEALNRGEIKFIQKTKNLSPAMQAYKEMVARGMPEDEALVNSGLNKLGYNVALANAELQNDITLKGVDYQNAMKLQEDAQAHGFEMEDKKHGNELGKLGYQFDLEQQGKEEDLRRAKELEEFKSKLTPQELRIYDAIAAKTNIPVEELYAGVLEEKNLAMKKAVADINKAIAEQKRANAQAGLYGAQAKNVKNPNMPTFSEIQTGVNNRTITAETGNQLYGQNVFQEPLSQEDKELAKQQAKNQAAQEKASQQVKNMMPRVLDAIKRAEVSLDEGTGLGQIGGWGWTTDKGGINRANIQNAQAQINTLMRGILSSMGVGATEMNSAVEAAAYRYMITPDMPEKQIKQVLDNFKKDYTSGALMQNIYDTASAFGGAGADGGYGLKIGTVKDGYRYIGGNPKFEKSWELIK